ncbi:unnamed protein product, partial [Gulo gulo]
MGFHGGCAAMRPLEEIVAVPGGPGQRGRGRLLGEESAACMPKRLPSSCDHSAPHSSASKAGGARSRAELTSDKDMYLDNSSIE